VYSFRSYVAFRTIHNDNKETIHNDNGFLSSMISKVFVNSSATKRDYIHLTD